MEDLSYEKSLERLEEVLDKLEEGKLPLEEHLELFEESVKLHKHCTDILSKTEKTIELILKDGEITEKEFSPEV